MASRCAFQSSVLSRPGSTSRRERIPWRVAFLEEMACPSVVLGPVEARAFLRFALILSGVVIPVSPK
jgi:hypothetical protein